MRTTNPFNPLTYPACLLQPDYQPPVIAWSGHLPFAFAVIDMCRPRILVELGTHYGNSFCAFCQAVDAVQSDTRCHAVDTWQGDPQAGQYGEEVIQTLKTYQEPRYGRFSKLIRSTFDDALEQFANGSIDLLHIDGLHTYDAVKHDFESWLPKMSSRGVILFHDTHVFENDFGVHKLWAELTQIYPSFEFKHSHGLGVLAVGTTPPAPLQSLVNSTPDETVAIRSFFTNLGQLWHEKYMAALQSKQSAKHIGQLDELVAAAHAQINNLNHSLAVHQALLTANGELNARLQTLVSNQELNILQKTDKIRRMQNSVSWKITAPLRAVRRWFNH
jgi:hypothetical protein